MNENQNDDLTTRLSRSLTGHADVMTGSSLGLDQVQGKARSIRRRRTATAVVAVAAAVAVIVPTAALAGHTGGKPEPAPATQTTRTPSPTTTATATDAAEPARGVLDVSDLPTGAAPRSDYVYRGRLYSADGGAGDVRSRYTPSSFVEMEDGSRVWLTTHDGSPYVEIQNSDGGFVDPVPSGSYDLSVNPTHSIAAWISPTGQLSVYQGRASAPHTLGDPVPGTEWRLGPITGDDCALACGVYVNGSDQQGNRQPFEVTESGTQEYLDGSYLFVNDSSEAGLTVGFTDIDDFKTCSTLLGGGEFQGFHTCRHQLLSFSPDGRLIWGTQTYFDGPGTTSITMFDLQGKPLFERRADPEHQAHFPVPGPAWEDASHLLVPMFQDGSWSVVRVASDGTMEYAVAPHEGPMEASPYILPTGGDLASLSG